MPASDARWRDRAAVAAPAALAAVLGAIGLTGRNLGFDEGATVAIVSQHGSALGSAIARDGGNMSGYYVVLHVLTGWFGTGLGALRIPSVACLAITAGVVAAIGVRLFDRRVGVVAGVLTAVNLPLVYWAQTARGYAPMVAFVCAGFLCFVMLADPSRRGSRGAVAGYAAAMVLACYCSFVAVFVVPVQLVALARRPAALRRLAVALAAVAVCCIPLAVLAVRRGAGQLFWVPRPSRKVESQVFQSLTSSGLSPVFHPTFTTTVALLATVLAVVGLAVASVRAGRRARWGTALVCLWAVLPVVLTFLYSLVGQPVFLPRNLLTCLPAVALVLALLICDRRVPRAAAAAVLLVAVGVRAVPLAASYGVSPEPWRQVTDSVLARAAPGDCVAFYPLDGRNAFRYYVARADPARTVPRAILPAVPWGSTAPFVERYVTLSAPRLTAASAGCARLWFVSSHEGQQDGPPRARANRAAYHALDRELVRAFGHGRIEQFGYASPIHVQLLSGAGRRRPG